MKQSVAELPLAACWSIGVAVAMAKGSNRPLACMAGMLITVAMGITSCATTPPEPIVSGPQSSATSPVSSPVPVEFSITVVNRSSHPAVVSLRTDIAGADQGFLPSQQGTIQLRAGTADNGVGLELAGFPGCTVQLEATYPSTTSFSLFLDDDPNGLGFVVSTGPAEWATTGPLPDNGLRCPQG